MTAKQLKAHKDALAKLRAETLSKGAAKIEPNRTDEASSGVADEDAQALSEMLQAINSNRNAGQAQLVARIDKALRKIADDPEMVGLCEECEEPIPAARLKAVPYAQFCAACQSKRDPARGMARKKTTDFV
ncbi:MAG: TraR/DksA family transcriptional regulator [Deltaproteobacteria bacterium]|nr:TraR/DksA family transcriptional regulator [Deltaproteobacteria bacterium]